MTDLQTAVAGLAAAADTLTAADFSGQAPFAVPEVVIRTCPLAVRIAGRLESGDVTILRDVAGLDLPPGFDAAARAFVEAALAQLEPAAADVVRARLLSGAELLIGVCPFPLDLELLLYLRDEDRTHVLYRVRPSEFLH